jgi:hypothetical protein
MFLYTIIIIYISLINLYLMILIQPQHTAKNLIVYIIILTIATLQKIFGISNLAKHVVKIAFPVFYWWLTSIIAIYVIRKIKEIGLN